MTRDLFHTLGEFLRFYSRLPAPNASGKATSPDFFCAAWGAPAAGAVIGAFGAGALVMTWAIGLPSNVAAIVAIGVLVAVTGALHEDGLADVADGFGGGVRREQKLAIMRDSRLGVYGVTALCFSLLLRIAALSILADRGVALAAMSLVAVGAVSRAAGLAPMFLLPPARTDGAGAMTVAPTAVACLRAGLVATVVSLTPVFAGLPLSQALGADAAAFVASVLVAGLARRQIGGYTGDVLGAAQQAAEIVALLALCTR